MRTSTARFRTAALALGALLSLAASACGDSGDPPDASGVSLATPVPSGEVPAGAALVDQDNLRFIPNALQVAGGEAVYFRNSETALHTVTINGLNVTGNMGKGDVMIWTAPAPGTYKFTCDYHPQMRATLTVD